MLSSTQKPKDLLFFKSCHYLHLIELACVFVLEIDSRELQQIMIAV